MVGLDTDAFGNIGIDGTLGQESDIVLLAGFFLKHADEFGTDDLALLLRIAYAGQLIQETVDRVHINQVGVHLVAEHFDYLFRLTLAQQAVVHVNGHQLFADSFDQQGGDDGRIHTAGQGQQDLFVSDLFLNGRDLFLNKGVGEFRGSDPLHAFGAFVAVHLFSSH